jgi:ankyrin repeat protein
MTEDEKYDLIFNALLNETVDEWEHLAQQFPDFPCGYRMIDANGEWYWINEAILCCPYQAVKWLIDRGANLRVKDADGYMPLHCCLERELPDKYEMLQLLIDSGADIDAGTDVENNMMAHNSWTPLHMAAVRGDLDAVKILLANGADTSIRTVIDDYATAEEEARITGNNEAAELIINYKSKAK